MATNREQHINNVTEDWLIENSFGKSNGYGKSGIPIFLTREDHNKNHFLNEYKINIDDKRPMLNIIVEKFRLGKIKKKNGIWVYIN